MGKSRKDGNFRILRGDLSLAICENKEVFKYQVKKAVQCLKDQCEGSPIKEIMAIIKG